MKKKTRFTQDKILSVLKEAAAGDEVEALCKEHGIEGDIPGKRRAKNGANRLKQLEEENRRLRSLVADLTLSNQALKLAVSKKW